MSDKGQKDRSDKNREIVLDVLLDIEQNKTFLSDALDKALRKIQFSDKKDRSFITREAEGVCEYMLSLDEIIGAFSKTPVRKLRPIIRNILRLGIYEMLFMDSVPARATISECVNMTKAHNMMKLSGFVNAILRNVDRKLAENGYHDSVSDIDSEAKARLERIAVIFELDTIAKKYSAPEWLAGFLIKTYGEEKAEKILLASFTKKKLTIRYNRTLVTKGDLVEKMTEKGISVTEGKYSDSALLIDNIDFVRRVPGYKDGFFSVQAESSMRAVEAAGIEEGMKVLDLCAAPGGKSTYAAELLGGTGEVRSRDVSDEKTDKIEENITRLKLENVTVEKADATVYDEKLEGHFDIVIADVPCSGLGVIGRKSDIKYRLVPEDLDSLKELSFSILLNAVRYVKKGGKLLFSTCTINPSENEETTRRLIKAAKQSNLELIDEKLFVQGIDDTDGFYYAVLKCN
ncbi:MAG: 16S rRNA (cytosine(967)-C(5))-methyltransferase RsmB [Eubacterium sp.]|nr:16S rRNA (cytosine(967)-C(5))-methyltransferase RsmB [Eubacterium sp.]